MWPLTFMLDTGSSDTTIPSAVANQPMEAGALSSRLHPHGDLRTRPRQVGSRNRSTGHGPLPSVAADCPTRGKFTTIRLMRLS
jgi:hypothetical protein